MSSFAAMAFALPILSYCAILLVTNPSVSCEEMMPKHSTATNPENVAADLLYNIISAVNLAEKAGPLGPTGYDRDVIGPEALFMNPISASLVDIETTDQMSKKAEKLGNNFSKFFGKRGFKPYSG